MKLKNLNIFFASDDKEYIDKIKSKRAKFRNLYTTNTMDFINFYINCNTNVDILILDLDTFCQNNEDIDFDRFLSICPSQQFIFLVKNIKNYEYILKNFNGGKSVILFKPIKSKAIIDNILLLCKKETKNYINLNKNVKIDLKKEQIFKDSSQIFLTNLEHKLILLLSQNIGKLTTFDTIENIIYDGQYPSKIAMQNLVGKLKRKLDLDIKNIHMSGYVLYDYNLDF